MKRIAIVMTHFNRDVLTKRSIESILSQNYKGEYIIIVVDDMSDVPFKYEHEKVKVIVTKKKDWYCQVVPYNIGLNYAFSFNPDAIIIQNSEAYHVGEILDYVNANLTDDNYLSFGCIASSRSHTENNTLQAIIGNYANIQCVMNDSDENAIGWYNHSIIFPRAFDFCSAISAENMKKLNGFDERFAKHTWYCDDNFRNRVRLLGLNTEIIDNPYVIHQWHSRAHQPFGYTDKSFKLYQDTINEKSYKAKHTITNDF